MEGTILNFLIDLCFFRFVFLIRNETISLIIFGFLSDQHLEICSDGVSPCESKEYSAEDHDPDAGNGFFSL